MQIVSETKPPPSYHLSAEELPDDEWLQPCQLAHWFQAGGVKLGNITNAGSIGQYFQTIRNAVGLSIT